MSALPTSARWRSGYYARTDGDVVYTYDAAGNRMTRSEDGETITYTLGVGDSLASWTGGAYTHDAAGNVTRIECDGRPTLDLVWNSQYQLVSVATNGVFAESYTYDALSRRVSTTTLEGTTRHVYDNNWQVIADIDEQGNVIASYVWGEGIDKLLAVTVGGSTYYALTDIQGTVWGYVDSQNNVVARWQYDAWGNVLDEEVAVPMLVKLRYRFQCREWSAATGLINFRMRWYDAETGRWLSKDPIGLSGGLNLYAFCRNSPMCFLDWLGLNALDSAASILGKVWNMPNTAIGLVYGAVGNAVGQVVGNNTEITMGNNAIQFQGNALVAGAITFGNVIIYGEGYPPGLECPEGTWGDHERQHTFQGELLGPFYLPAHLMAGAAALLTDKNWHGDHNPLESGPSSNPPHPWPWPPKGGCDE